MGRIWSVIVGAVGFALFATPLASCGDGVSQRNAPQGRAGDSQAGGSNADSGRSGDGAGSGGRAGTPAAGSSNRGGQGGTGLGGGTGGDLGRAGGGRGGSGGGDEAGEGGGAGIGGLSGTAGLGEGGFAEGGAGQGGAGSPIDPECIGAFTVEGDQHVWSAETAEALRGVGRIMGSLTIEGVADLSAFHCLSALQYLYIRETAITDLDELSNLREVEYVDVSNNAQLRSVDGLAVLRRWPSFSAHENPALTNIDGLAGLRGAESVALVDCPALDSIDGLQGLEGGAAILSNLGNVKTLDALRAFRRGDIFLQELPALENLLGLSGVTDGDRVTLQSLPLVTDLRGLESAASIDELEVSDCPRLTNLRGLDSLTKAGSIGLAGLDSLTSLDGLQSLQRTTRLFLGANPALTSIGALESLTSLKYLSVFDNDALLDLNGLQGVTGLEALWINDNASLETLRGLENVAAVSGDLSITSDPGPNDLEGLEGLTMVGGDLNLWMTLDSLRGLENLLSVEGDLVVGASASLAGLSNLTFVGGSFDVTSVAGPLDAVGPPRLERVGGDLRIQGPLWPSVPTPITVTGFDALSEVQNVSLSSTASVTGFQSLTTVPGSITLGYSPSFVTLDAFPNVTSAGLLRISAVSPLTNLAGFGRLTRVDELWISGTSITDMDGLQSLTSAGAVLLEGNPNLLGLDDLVGLQRVDTTLRIYANSKLDDLRGLASLGSVARLEVVNNEGLAACEVDWLVASIGPANVGAVVSSGNDGALPCTP